MSAEVAEAFRHGDTAERAQLIRDPAAEVELRTYLGDAAYDEYRAMAGPEHLAPGVPPNLLFVPGVMGSLLDNQSKGGVAWIDVRTRHVLDRLALNPDGDGDADPSDSMRAFNVDFSYDRMLDQFSRTATVGHRTFPYDWRKDLSRSSSALVEKVKEMRAENGGQRVHLVAHSMGGLMIRTALRDDPGLWKLIGRVVFVGTPHFGTPAITTYLKNHFWGVDPFVVLGLYLSRPTLRSMWGVLSMLPAPTGVYPGTRPGEPQWRNDEGPGHPTANFDHYDVDAYKLDDLPGEHQARLQRILEFARANHQSLAEVHDALDPEQRERMLMIAGVGEKTVFRLEFDKTFLWERAKKVTRRSSGDVHREGDGRVPVASALLPNVTTRYVAGIHGGLPNLPAVIDDVLAFLDGGELKLASSPKGAAQGHLAPGTASQSNLDGTSLLLEESVSARDGHEDEGIWKAEPPSAERIREITGLLEQEMFPAFHTLKLL